MTDGSKPRKWILAAMVLVVPTLVVLFLRRQYGIDSEVLASMPLAVVCAVGIFAMVRDGVVERTQRERKRRAAKPWSAMSAAGSEELHQSAQHPSKPRKAAGGMHPRCKRLIITTILYSSLALAATWVRCDVYNRHSTQRPYRSGEATGRPYHPGSTFD